MTTPPGRVLGLLRDHPIRIAVYGTAAILLVLHFMDCSTVDPTALKPALPLSKKLREHVETLAQPAWGGRKPGSEGHSKAAAWIEAIFKEIGLKPLPSLGGYRQRCPLGNVGDNIIGFLPGRSKEWIVVGAHYDHLGKLTMGTALGADDNASAVAIMIEAARLEAQRKTREHNLLVVSWTAEEPPYFLTPKMGSKQFMEKLPQEIGKAASIRLAVVMDLMGSVWWKPLLDRVFVMGAEKSRTLTRLVDETDPVAGLTISRLGIHMVEMAPGGPHPVSDYVPFRSAGVPWLFLSCGRTPRYHQSSDTPDTLSYDRMSRTVEWLDRLTRRALNLKGRVEYDRHREDHAQDARVMLPLARLASSWRTRIPRSSPISVLKMGRDLDTVAKIATGEMKAEGKALKKLRRSSVRLQCLLMDLYICFLL